MDEGYSDESPSQIIMEIVDILKSDIRALTNILTKIINRQENVQALEDVLKKLDKTRQLINDAYGMGVVIKVDRYGIYKFELTGDPEKDFGQKRNPLT